jgi:hypothetical protein
MNTKQNQYNRQKVTALLLAGSILAATAGLTYANLSFGPAERAAGPEKADSAHYARGALPWSHLRSVKGGARGGVD